MRRVTRAAVSAESRGARPLPCRSWSPSSSSGAAAARRVPVDFERWLARRSGRKTAEFPDSWRVRTDLKFAEPSRVGVLVHVYYAELIAELLTELEALPVGFDLIVTNASEHPITIDGSRLPRMRNCVVVDVENHGRDIWPMVQVVNAGLLNPYELVLKLHTKRSAWREQHELEGSGEEWRSGLLAALLGGRENVIGHPRRVRREPGPRRGHCAGKHPRPGVLGRRPAPDPRTAAPPRTRGRPRLAALPGRFVLLDPWLRPAGPALARPDRRGLRQGGRPDRRDDGARHRALDRNPQRGGGFLARRRATRCRRPDRTSWHRYEHGATAARRVRVLPFYLPQFHPTPENDMWWGRGFTEWTNVTAARPVYEGHNQPNLPADLGFYDLRLDEVRQAQMELAAAHGIEGFMYYYYWFAGKRLLSEPIEALLRSDVNKPFCIMWANENWTRRWDGRTSDILMGQDYKNVPASRFLDDVLPFLRRPALPASGGQARARRLPDRPDPRLRVGDRAVAPARPRRRGRASCCCSASTSRASSTAWRAAPRRPGSTARSASRRTTSSGTGCPTPGSASTSVSAATCSATSRWCATPRCATASMADTDFPGVMVTFDNTARRQWNSDVWFGSNPYTFRRWLAAAASAVSHREPEHRIVFINAWNEWAESAVLEPTHRHGYDLPARRARRRPRVSRWRRPWFPRSSYRCTAGSTSPRSACAPSTTTPTSACRCSSSTTAAPNRSSTTPCVRRSGPGGASRSFGTSTTRASSPR